MHKAYSHGEEERMILIAEMRSAATSGHYHADKRLIKQCDEAYVDWTRKYCADAILGIFMVAEVDAGSLDLVSEVE
jgi:hypothetical protein